MTALKKITIGIDPDGEKHGIAWTFGDKELHYSTMTLFDFYRFLIAHIDYKVVIHYENVLANTSIFERKGAKTPKAAKEVARCVGLNQQSLVELLRMIPEVNHPDITLHGYKISSKWKDSAEGKYWMAIHWKTPKTKRSNEEERSAAYFLTAYGVF